jgi:hypothetical protein
MNTKNDNINESESAENTRMFLMPLSKAAELTDYTCEHLNLLCRRGVLKGKKIGRNWHTTREWLNEFLLSPGANTGKRYKRRKKINKEILPSSELQKVDEAIYKTVATPKRELKTVDKKLKREIDKINHELVDKNLEWDGGSDEIVIPAKEKNKLLSYARYGKTKYFSKQDNQKWYQVAGRIAALTVISFFLFFGISFYQYFMANKYIADKNLPQDLKEDIFLINSGKGLVSAGETSSQNATETAIATSENFKLKEISLGGTLIASANGDNLPLEISDIQSQAFTSKDGKDTQILISWKTNKLAVSEISYGKNNSTDTKTLQEKFYGFNHNAVLVKLDLATTYVYTIKSTDKWGNAVTSDNFGIYTGSKVASVFDLIIKALSDTFSWAIKK